MLLGQQRDQLTHKHRWSALKANYPGGSSGQCGHILFCACDSSRTQWERGAVSLVLSEHLLESLSVSLTGSPAKMPWSHAGPPWLDKFRGNTRSKRVIGRKRRPKSVLGQWAFHMQRQVVIIQWSKNYSQTPMPALAVRNSRQGSAR